MPDTVKVHAEPSADAMRLPAIALRGLVVFPDNVIHFEVGREKSIAAIDWAMNNNSPVFLVTQKEMDTEQPGMEDLYTYGVIAEIKQMLRVSDELVKVLVEGKTRARLPCGGCAAPTPRSWKLCCAASTRAFRVTPS